MALKPKDVRVPLPAQLILDCHRLVCVRGEGLTDRSIKTATSDLHVLHILHFKWAVNQLDQVSELIFRNGLVK